MGERKQKKARKNSQDLKHLDLDTANAASTTDFTGLIPSGPQSDAEVDAYNAVYNIDNKAKK